MSMFVYIFYTTHFVIVEYTPFTLFKKRVTVKLQQPQKCLVY